jgi:uncharacterized protein (DUF1800 family)
MNHALNRLAFGAHRGAQHDVVKPGWKEWAGAQLRPDSIDDDKCEALVRQRCPSLALSLRELAGLNEERSQEVRRESQRRIKDELRESVLLRAVYSRRQFQEVIVEFWRNHFNVDVNKVPFLATHFEEHVLRKHAFGKFDELLLATAQHPAMLVYLDNFISNRRGVNENYARELMELHSLGVDSHYTQDDVVSLSRVLTGWSCGWSEDGRQRGDYGFRFNPRDHDPQPARLIDIELDGRDGLLDGQRAIRFLAHHPGTAKFVATKLCRYLVDDRPPQSLIERVATVFDESGGNLVDVYEAVVLSPEFTRIASYRGKFKTPFEFVASTLRATDARIKSANSLFGELERMGQPIYECVEPIGYADQREAWLDPGVMIYRWNFAIALVTGKIAGVEIGERFIEQMKQPQPIERARAIMKLLLPGVRDRNLEELIASTPNVRAQLAYALGSPAFQQQ